jgi:hypothetical protein
MTQMFEFDLVFSLPEEGLDPMTLSEAIYSTGHFDAVIGTGQQGIVAVALEVPGDDAESVIVESARRILSVLPAGSTLREVRPDLVSLAEVANRLGIKRQALQKRKMPPPLAGGLFRVTEIAVELLRSEKHRRARFRTDQAQSWFAAAQGAQRVNARLALGVMDGRTLQYGQTLGQVAAE